MSALHVRQWDHHMAAGLAEVNVDAKAPPWVSAAASLGQHVRHAVLHKDQCGTAHCGRAHFGEDCSHNPNMHFRAKGSALHELCWAK